MKLCRAIADAVPGLTCSREPTDRICYARDLWPRHHIDVRAGRIADHQPAAVAWPESTEQVAQLVRWCARQGVELVPFGAGSGVCSGVLPGPDTVVLDLKKLDRWRRLDPEQGIIETEAGVQGIRLEEELNPQGWTVGHYPSSILCSTVGGWVAARGAGQCSGLYGKIEDMVAALECVDGRGEVATLRRRVHGPDLVPLMVGSEGVLGVITSAQLRLHPMPAHRACAGFVFHRVEDGCEAIREIYQRGLRPAVCRLYDPFDSMIARLGAAMPGGHHDDSGVAPGLGLRMLGRLLRRPGAMNGVIEAAGAELLGGAMLVLVFEGPRGDSEQQCAEAIEVARAYGARHLGPAPAEHWLERRYTISYRQAPMFMIGAFSDTMEVAAPWSSLMDLYDGVRRALQPHVFVMAHFSHAYPDGCSIYFTFAGSAADDEACLALYDRAWSDGLDAALAAGGTLSHHHGVGRSKATKLGAELGVGLDLLGSVRESFDPTGIFNRTNLQPKAAPGDPAAVRPPSPRLTSPKLDRQSQLVSVDGETTLAELESFLHRYRLSLGCTTDPEIDAMTIARWLAKGAPGAPDRWLDPVDQLLAGFAAELASGAILDLAPGPRRAVGPELSALFFGTEERVGKIRTAHLRVRGPRSARPLLTNVPRQPPLESTEAAWVDRVLDGAAKT